MTDPALRELADLLGVATEYDDWQGNHVVVPEETIIAVLGALGRDVAGPDATAAALDELRLAPWRQRVPPCTVLRAGLPGELQVHVPDGGQVTVSVRLEDGDVRRLHRLGDDPEACTVDGQRRVAATFELPADLPLGWHTVCLQLQAADSSRPADADDTAEGTLVITPARIALPERLGEGRAWGFMTQLYSVRSARSWGLGDLGDLQELARWSGHDLGAGFVLVNPLHAGEPVAPIEPSPYLPVSRRFGSPLYLRVEDIEEYADLPRAALATVEAMAEQMRLRSHSADELDRDAVWGAKQVALALVHTVARSGPRQEAYEAFVEREGEGLLDFATWCALAEKHGLPVESWPADLHDPRSPAVTAARAELADVVDFYRWLQWVLDGQLAAAQWAARDAGMPLGVIHDLAVGVHRGGADAWAMPEALARGVNVGAPADAFNQQGQDWSQPPWRPDALVDLAYAPFRAMIRTVLRHAGGVRVDHVIGLFRLWWVPQGMAPSTGTYVRYDHEALVGILALEASRAGALVVGEDLGNVEPWVRTYLAERGILGTSILWFEQDWNAVGGPQPLQPEQWRELCLATVTTHDLPPTAGYLLGEHIRIRSQLGLLTRPVEEERRLDAEDRDRWIDLLRARGLLDGSEDPRRVTEALHRYLARTPSRLLGVALPDAVGDVRVINQPGTHREYPNWSLPLADGSGRPVLLDELVGSERARALAVAIAGR